MTTRDEARAALAERIESMKASLPPSARGRFSDGTIIVPVAAVLALLDETEPTAEYNHDFYEQDYGREPVPAGEREALASAAYGAAQERYMGQRMHVGTATDREIAAFVQGAHFAAGFHRQGPTTGTMVEAALAEFTARVNNAIQPTRGTMRAALEAAEAARPADTTGEQA